MFVEFLSHYSGELGREMKINRYGNHGVPILVFPSSGGSHNEYADFGMIEACRYFIDSGKVQFFTLSCIDSEAWLSFGKSAYDKMQAHQAYDRYIIKEAIPFIKHHSGYFDPMMVTGCSMGGYQSMNFFLHHPDVFNTVIALSGIYNASFFVDHDADQPQIYQYFPQEFIWNQQDPWFLEHYRQANIIVCTGLGPWEQDGLPSFYALKEGFDTKGIATWFDVWGHDAAHDWSWWRKQKPYFLDKLNL